MFLPVETLRVEAGLPDEQFDNLLEYLNSELRLVSQRFSGGDPQNGEPSKPEPNGYELTHDFLVPAIRRWLAPPVVESEVVRTARQMMLEFSRTWQSPKAHGRVPTIWQYLKMSRHVPRPWNGPVERMMAAARSEYATVVFGGVVVLAGIAAWCGMRVLHISGRVDMLATAEAAEVTPLLGELAVLHGPVAGVYVERRLASLQRSSDRSRALRASVVLLSRGHRDQALQVSQGLLLSPVAEATVIARWLYQRPGGMPDELGAILKTQVAEQAGVERLLAMATLAQGRLLENERQLLAHDAAVELLKLSKDALGQYCDALRPLSHELSVSIANEYRAAPIGSPTRHASREAILKLATEEPKILARFCVDASPDDFPTVMDVLVKRPASHDAASQALDTYYTSGQVDVPGHAQRRRRVVYSGET